MSLIVSAERDMMSPSLTSTDNAFANSTKTWMS